MIRMYFLISGKQSPDNPELLLRINKSNKSQQEVVYGMNKANVACLKPHPSLFAVNYLFYL